MEFGLIILIISIICFIITIIAFIFVNNMTENEDLKGNEVKFHPCLDPTIDVLSEDNLLDHVHDACKSECKIDTNNDKEIILTKLKSKSTSTRRSCFLNKYKGKCEEDSNCLWDETGLNINNGGICKDTYIKFIDCNETEQDDCKKDNDCEWNDIEKLCDFKIIKEVVDFTTPEIETIIYTKPPCIDYSIGGKYITIGGKIP